MNSKYADHKYATQLKAYEDIEFLKRDESRAIRLQLEFLKPDTIMQEHMIRSTIVLFGSARILAPDKAQVQLEAAVKALAGAPSNAELQQQLTHAEKMVEMSHYYALAREFGALVSRACQSSPDWKDFVIMTGGGGGIMEAGNRGAADVGAKSIGLNISLPFEQDPNPYITPELLFYFHYFSIRKMHFLKRAKALCAFPGGYGTMDELFETLTLIQTRKLKPMPVVLFGREFWEKCINWDYFTDCGLTCPEDRNSFHFAETAQDGWDYIRTFWTNESSVLDNKANETVDVHTVITRKG